MNHAPYFSPSPNIFDVIETIPDTALSSPKPIHASQGSSSTSNNPSSDETPTKPNQHTHFTKHSRQPSKLDRILTWIKSLPHQNPSIPSSPIEPASPEHTPETHIKHEHLPHQTAILHSLAQHSILYTQPFPNAPTQLPPTQNVTQTDVQLQQNQLPCRQPITNACSEEPSSSHPQKPPTEQQTLLRRFADALRRRDVERHTNNTLIMHGNADEEILELTEYNERDIDMQSSPSYKDLSDSSSIAFTENFETTRPHGTLSTSSSDLGEAQRDETVSAVPQQLKRTYTSSEDSLEMETLSSATVDEVTITTFATSEDSSITSNTSTPYTISEDSHTAYELSVTIPELDVSEYEAMSVSSGDADLAWLEEFIQPLPPIVGRTYSSSESEESRETSDGALMNSFTEAATINSGHSLWTSEDVSEILSNQGPSRSQRGYIQSDPNWLEESKEERQSNTFETVEPLPKLRTSSQTRTSANNVDQQYAKSKKPHILKKAARLMSQIFSGRTSRSPDGHRSETQTGRKSFSSFFWGR